MSPAELILKLDIDVRSHSFFESTLNSAIVSYRIVWATILILLSCWIHIEFKNQDHRGLHEAFGRNRATLKD